jgi:hypothetical protein
MAAPTVATSADAKTEVEALLAPADARVATGEPALSGAPSKPAEQAPTRTSPPAPLLDNPPRPRDTVLAVGGGLLVVVLAAIGLTITFRSLRADLRGRRHRYRRRARREARSA